MNTAIKTTIKVNKLIKKYNKEFKADVKNLTELIILLDQNGFLEEKIYNIIK